MLMVNTNLVKCAQLPVDWPILNKVRGKKCDKCQYTISTSKQEPMPNIGPTNCKSPGNWIITTWEVVPQIESAQTNSSSSNDEVAIGQYFLKKRTPEESMAKLQEVNKKQLEDLERISQEQAEQQAEKERKERESLLALLEEINRKEDEAEKREQERLSLELIKTLKDTPDDEQPKKKGKETKTVSPKKKQLPSASERLDQADKAKLEEFDRRRVFPERIISVQLRKIVKSPYPAHIIPNQRNKS